LSLKALIIDDEKASQETLAHYLKTYCQQVVLCGIADGVKSGLLLIKKHQPDLVFLDIEMPFGNGFDLLEQLESVKFEVIFTTAFSEYALKAIQVSAARYLLKPIDIDQLVEAVEAVEANHEQEQRYVQTRILVENVQLHNRQLHKMVLPTMEGFEVVPINEVIHCTAQDNFTEFHLKDGSKKLICRSLKHYEELLFDFNFIRVHKSHLINSNYVQKYRKGKGGVVVMSNKAEIEVSASRKADFLKHFQTIKRA
jgi:two-component system LytT family response regulator